MKIYKFNSEVIYVVIYVNNNLSLKKFLSLELYNFLYYFLKKQEIIRSQSNELERKLLN